MIPLFFLWSPKYEILAKILNASLKTYTNVFNVMPLFVEQSVFDKELKPEAGHYFAGCTLKMAKIYDLLCNLEENTYFVFCDADIVFFEGKPVKELFDIYTHANTNADIIFMRESMTSEVCNCGFALIKVCEENRKLYKRVLDDFVKQPTAVEQTLVNNQMASYTGIRLYFPPEFVATTSTLAGLETRPNWHVMRNNTFVFQAICNGESNNQIVTKLQQYGVFDIDKKYFGCDAFKSQALVEDFLKFIAKP